MFLPTALVRRLPGVRWRESATEPTVYLTFDDGPHPEATPRILEALAEADCVATFFLTGKLVDETPELVERIVAEGHAIGNHGAEHLAPGDLLAAGYTRHAVETQMTLDRLVGPGLPRMFRPPYGKVSAATYRRLRRHDFEIVLWSLDSGDSSCQASEPLCRALLPDRVRAGEIVLLHDDYPWTAEALPAVLARFREHGLRCGRLDHRAACSRESAGPDRLTLARPYTPGNS